MSVQISRIAGAGEEGAFTIADRERGATLADLPEVYRRLIDGPYVVTLATHDDAGRIQLTPMWFRAAADGARVEINTVRGRAKERHMRRAPDVTIQITNPENPYHWVTIYGRVDEIVEESDPARGREATDSIDDLAELYLGQRPYPLRSPGEERVLFYVSPTQIVTFGQP